MKKDIVGIKIEKLQKKRPEEQLEYCQTVINKIKKVTSSDENINTLLVRHLFGEMGGAYPDDILFFIKDLCIEFMAALAHPSAKEFIDHELFEMEDLQRLLKGLIQFCHSANNGVFIPELDIAYLEENGVKALGWAVSLEEQYK